MVPLYIFLGVCFAIMLFTSGVLYFEVRSLVKRLDQRRISLEELHTTLQDSADELEKLNQRADSVADRLRIRKDEENEDASRTLPGRGGEEDGTRKSPPEGQENETEEMADRRQEGGQWLSPGASSGMKKEEMDERRRQRDEEAREAFVRACKEAAENLGLKKCPGRSDRLPIENGFMLLIKTARFMRIKGSFTENIDVVIYRHERCIRKKTLFFNVGRYLNEVQILSLLNGAGGAPELRAVSCTFTTLIMSERGNVKLASFVLDEKAKGNLQPETLRGVLKRICLRVRELHLKGVSHNSLSLDNVVANDLSEPLYLVDFQLSSPLGKPFICFQGNPFLACIPGLGSRRMREEHIRFLKNNVAQGIVTTAFDVHSIGLIMLQVMEFHGMVNTPLEDLARRAVNFEFGEWPSVEEFAQRIEDVME